jgi:hypothetical protein
MTLTNSKNADVFFSCLTPSGFDNSISPPGIFEKRWYVLILLVSDYPFSQFRVRV